MPWRPGHRDLPPAADAAFAAAFPRPPPRMPPRWAHDDREPFPVPFWRVEFRPAGRPAPEVRS